MRLFLTVSTAALALGLTAAPALAAMAKPVAKAAAKAVAKPAMAKPAAAKPAMAKPAMAPAAPAAAVATPAAPAPAAAPAVVYSTADTDIGTLIDKPATRAILDQFLPGLSTDDRIGMARGMTLRAIQPMAGDKISVEALDKIDAALAALFTKK